MFAMSRGLLASRAEPNLKSQIEFEDGMAELTTTASVRRPPKQEKVMANLALYVPLEAKPGKEKDVADFLRSAVPLVSAEAGTVSWYAIQEGPSSFAIFDTFDDEVGRDAHLNGKVAAALMEKVKAGDMFARTPEIHKLRIIAHKPAK
jgi:quinol monooxygenase YgiN